MRDLDGGALVGFLLFIGGMGLAFGPKEAGWAAMLIGALYLLAAWKRTE